MMNQIINIIKLKYIQEHIQKLNLKHSPLLAPQHQ
jgi:hypothetical protein